MDFVWVTDHVGYLVVLNATQLHYICLVKKDMAQEEMSLQVSSFYFT